MQVRSVTPVYYTNQNIQKNNNQQSFGAAKFPKVVLESLDFDSVLNGKNPAFFSKDNFMYMGTKQGSKLEEDVLGLIRSTIARLFGNDEKLLKQTESISTEECKAIQHWDTRDFDVE